MGYSEAVFGIILGFGMPFFFLMLIVIFMLAYDMLCKMCGGLGLDAIKATKVRHE